MLRSWLALAVGLVLAGSAQASGWADGMFSELNKDFGSVPRGPALVHPFHLKNNTKQPVQISGVRVSCGCTSAFAETTFLAPGQETTIVARMDTTRFIGVKSVKIYVSFSQPAFEEVSLWVQANSRDDVMVTPDAINFGLVKRSSIPSVQVSVSFLGASQAKITAIKCESNYVIATAQEVRRDSGETAYKLTAQLRADAPAGKWYTDIWLVTNNPATPRVRVPLTVEIQSNLSVSPSLVDLGQVKIGGQAERKVIVRGVQPFRIIEVQGADDQVKVLDPSNESRQVHVLAITLKAAKLGEIKRSLKILTDLKEESEVEFQAKAQVMPEK